MLRFLGIALVGLFVLALFFTAMHFEEPYTLGNFLQSLLFNCVSFAVASVVLSGIACLVYCVKSSVKAKQRKLASKPK